MKNMQDTKNIVILALALVCIVLAGALIYFQGGSNNISADQAANTVLNYVNNTLLQGLVTAEIVGDVIQEAGLYKMKLNVGGEEFFSYITKDGKTFFPQGINLEEIEEPVEKETETIGMFSVSTDEVCMEDGKPLFYFFGSENCSHCNWEHPVVEAVAAEFGDAISFHNNMDVEADMDVFSKYSTGGIPALVIGCRYYRLGSGERMGEQEEANALKALLCNLTQGQPAAVCETVQELIDQI